MGAETYIDGAYRTFTAHTPADLVGKEHYLVEQRSDGLIQLLTSGRAIGVLHQRLEGGSDWTVRLLGKGGTVKMIAGGVIATPGLLKGASGGKVVAAGTSGRAVGLKVSPTANSAANDIIEVIDLVEPVITPQTEPTLAATGNTDGEIAGLSFSATVTQAEGQALRDKCEELADDVRALKSELTALVTVLKAAGVLTAA